MKVIRVNAKSAYTKTKIPGVDYVINHYVGCEHACKYCYAKFMCKRYNLEEWGSWIVVKENTPKLVRKYVRGLVFMCSVSDAYQPIEKELELTRKILENMNKKTKLSILTKSDLVLRDVDLFKRFKSIRVGLTLNTFYGKVKREIEPLSPRVEDRINALKELHENNIENYAFISPIIPELTDIEEILRETKDFIKSYFFEFLNLKASGRDFVEWLKYNYPRSYEILSDEDLLKRYVKSTVETVRNFKIEVKGIYIHNV